MATRNIQKALALTDIRDWPTASGIGEYGGQIYVNINGAIYPIGGVPFSNVSLVDGDNGSDTDERLPYKTIQAAVTDASANDKIYIKPLASSTAGIAAGTAGDPPGYAETIIIPPGKEGLSLIGVSRGVSQGAQPQVRIGTGSTAMLTVRSFGCSVHNLGFNGASSTGGGILLDSDTSTKDAGGLVVTGCHFKNCKGATSTQTAAGIYWSTNGGSWYVTIANNDFFDCKLGIAMLGSGASRPKDVKILGNRFYSSDATAIGGDILTIADGIDALLIDGNVFGTIGVPQFTTGDYSGYYLQLAGCTNGLVSNNVFNCIGKTFGTATVNAALFPTTVGFVNNYQENGTTQIVVTAN